METVQTISRFCWEYIKNGGIHLNFLDAWGWVFSAIYAVGNIMIARKHRTGWLWRIVGATGWIWVGVSVGLTSIFFIEGTAVVTSIYGFYKWKKSSVEGYMSKRILRLLAEDIYRFRQKHGIPGEAWHDWEMAEAYWKDYEHKAIDSFFKPWVEKQFKEKK